MTSPSRRLLWGLVAGGCALAVASSFVLTDWLALAPCHLCIFQRLLFMVLTVLAVGAGLAGAGMLGRLLGIVTLPVSATGIGVAAYQSWLQLQPSGSVSCVAGTPGLIERWVEWLGQQAPTLFMATGFCEDEGALILGLSLANWALIGFALCLGAGALALFGSRAGSEAR
ncbi:disulfide bond formation protein B [Thiocapsa bogorovii]|uniref:disulfide bond formation protein B n=1 Tax=Thiocapsa bogorovii TaxID=521689 RepID=UPI001E4440E9|nr:disulfide bond formation protein B [Thiocapsa bogorovii]UHD15418.1 disulfide bond formation protein B [Thiocapsa bogorovii]